MSKLSKFESAPLLQTLSKEQILNLAGEARELRSQGHKVPEGLRALSLAWVIREYKALSKGNEDVLDKILPTLPSEVMSESIDNSDRLEEESVI